MAVRRFAPIFSVGDLEASLAFYAQLGFETRAYEGGGYGFATMGEVELHLGCPPEGAEVSPVTAYLFVDDADELAERWAATGADVRPPEDTPWRQHEGVLIDPDHNLIRFGSPVR